ncbi:MAG TPA: hypothetical protein VLB80_00045 [Candidatus Babeliales bacterium]|nr:hypothetical protein [Candidatus Babeliales bacterium]
MKKKLILIVSCSSFRDTGGETKKSMKLFKYMTCVAMLCAIGFVNGRGKNPSQQQGAQQQQQQIPQQQIPQQQPQLPVVTKERVATTVDELMKASVPWDAKTQEKYDQIKSKLSSQQENDLLNMYTPKYQAWQVKQGQLFQKPQQQPGQQKKQSLTLDQMLQQQQEVKQPLTKEQLLTLEDVGSGALDRAKSLLYWGGGKLGSAWEKSKEAASSAWESTVGEYGSSMGGWKYLLPGALLFSGSGALVAGASAAATALWALGGSAAVLTLSNTFDRLNYAYKTGNLSEAAYLDEIKKQLALVLNDQAAYPYYTSKIEALRSQTELYPMHQDEFGVAKKAHEALLNESYQKAGKIATIPKEKEKEDKFFQMITDIREKHGYDPTNLISYIQNLERGTALIEAQALVSEYNRAKNREIIREKQAQEVRQKKAKKIEQIKIQISAPSALPVTSKF